MTSFIINKPFSVAEVIALPEESPTLCHAPPPLLNINWDLRSGNHFIVTSIYWTQICLKKSKYISEMDSFLLLFSTLFVFFITASCAPAGHQDACGVLRTSSLDLNRHAKTASVKVSIKENNELYFIHKKNIYLY